MSLQVERKVGFDEVGWTRGLVKLRRMVGRERAETLENAAVECLEQLFELDWNDLPANVRAGRGGREYFLEVAPEWEIVVGRETVRRAGKSPIQERLEIRRIRYRKRRG